MYDIDLSEVDTADRVVDFTKHDLIGEAKFEMSDMVCEPQGLLLQLHAPSDSNDDETSHNGHKKHKHGLGFVRLRAEEVADANATVSLVVSCTNLKNMDRFSKSDPFILFSAIYEDNTTQPVLKTEVVKNRLSPTFKPIESDIRTLCNGDPYRPLLIQVFDWDSSGSHDLIGETRTSIVDLSVSQ